QLAEILLQSGNSVIVDATFLQRHHREQMQQLAVQQEVPFQILDFDLPTEELRRRVTQRQQQTGQISEATCAVLEYQLMHQDPLAEHEKRLSLQITPDMSAASVCTMMVGAETAQFLATP
ncbi:MAG: ATP-binding protein, partial [Deltaproteobacteria bacterium]|nr:ATP-binding protein [Deltaproteobacteria bacterium]